MRKVLIRWSAPPAEEIEFFSVLISVSRAIMGLLMAERWEATDQILELRTAVWKMQKAAQELWKDDAHSKMSVLESRRLQ